MEATQALRGGVAAEGRQGSARREPVLIRLDLHIHTVASDGAWTPEQVVEGAVAGHLDVIALADHDTTAGVDTAVDAARGQNLQVVPASELSATREGHELHILGYFLDPSNARLAAYEERARQRRLERMEEMVERLRGVGVHVELAAVLEEAGPRRTMVGRPHLARAMVSAGHVASVPEAFDRYIADGLPAFVPTDLGDPGEAIEVIVGAGGIPVWAHPRDQLLDLLLPELRRAGLLGVEAYRPGWHPERCGRVAAAARRQGLVVSGGSDWHDPERNAPLGDFFVTGEEVAEFLELGGL